MRLIAFSSRLVASSVAISLACSAISARASSGVAVPEELVDQPEVHRQGVDLPLVLPEDPVLVVGEGGEPVGVLPHPLVGGVEEVGAVLVHLDAGLGVALGVGVAAQVGAAPRTSTRRPRSLAARSAMVRPKKPEPTISRSGRSPVSPARLSGTVGQSYGSGGHGPHPPRVAEGLENVACLTPPAAARAERHHTRRDQVGLWRGPARSRRTGSAPRRGCDTCSSPSSPTGRAAG